MNGGAIAGAMRTVVTAVCAFSRALCTIDGVRCGCIFFLYARTTGYVVVLTPVVALYVHTQAVSRAAKLTIY